MTVASLFYREEHIQKKIDSTIAEAKAKMAKNDKKGKESSTGSRNKIIFDPVTDDCVVYMKGPFLQ